MSTSAQIIQRYQAARAAIRSALAGKGIAASTHNFEDFATDIGNIATGATLQTKSATPTESAQTVTADAGYDGLDQVNVGAISSDYVGSGIARKSSSDLTASGSTVSVPAGFYENAASKSVSTATHANPSVSVNSSTGLITATHTQSAGYVAAGTTTDTEQLSVQAGTTVSPTESEQTAVAANKYTTGAVKVGAISNTYVGSGIARKSSTDLTASGATVSVPAGYYQSNASKSVTTMTLPTSASSSATSGYTSKATLNRSTSDRYINIPPGYNSSGGYYKISAVADGSEGTPTATKGTVSNHAVTVTPSVTNTAGYISGGTKTGTGVSVAASELVSGELQVSQNGQYDVTNYASIDVSVGSGAGVVVTDEANAYGGITRTITGVDLGSDTVIAAALGAGYTAHDKDGNPVTGTATIVSKMTQAYRGYATVSTTSYTATSIKLTVAKAGTYNITWQGWRSYSSGTFGSQLYKNDTAVGTASTSFLNTYGHSVTLSNQSLAKDDELVIYARAGATNRYMAVGNLIIEEV